MAITQEDFQFLTTLIKKNSGMVIQPERSYLLDSRLTTIARRWNAKSLAELVELVRKSPQERLLRDIIEAMMFSDSAFFRDIKPFEQFHRFLLPMMMQARTEQRFIRIWSAGCGVGQEAYSLAMLLADEKIRLKDWVVEIIATDLSSALIERAQSGVFSHFEVQRGLPIQKLVRHFKPVGERWQIGQEIKNMITFSNKNLLDDILPLGRFDFVFCRNVLSGFDTKTASQILEEFHHMLPSDGALVLGKGETTDPLTQKFRRLNPENDIYLPVSDRATPTLLSYASH